MNRSDVEAIYISSEAQKHAACWYQRRTAPPAATVVLLLLGYNIKVTIVPDASEKIAVLLPPSNDRKEGSAV